MTNNDHSKGFYSGSDALYTIANASTLINPIFKVMIYRFIDFDFFESGRAAGKNNHGLLFIPATWNPSLGD